MIKFKTKHFLTGAELSRDELTQLLELGETCRQQRQSSATRRDLNGKTVALLFEKPSLRTRVSFSVAIHELGGFPLVIDSQGRKKEDPEDTVRVLGGYCHGIMLRTHGQDTLDRMVAKSTVPVINGLSDTHHPCQAIADLLTLKQRYGELKGLKLAYIGDGNNVLHSLLMLAPFLGVDVHYACPPGFEPNSLVVKSAKQRAKGGQGSVTAHVDPKAAVQGANAVYTDVWTSMGFEQEETAREQAFYDYQLNESLYECADSKAAIMHCMPLVREKEITSGMVEHPNAVLFQQSENRMHAQKALLIGLMGVG